MGWFGGSDSTTNVHNDNDSYNIQAESAEVMVAGVGNTITTTDHGAIEGAFGFAEELGNRAFDFGGEALSANTEIARSGMATAERLAYESIDATKSLASESMWMTAEQSRDAQQRMHSLSQSALEEVSEQAMISSSNMQSMASQNSQRIERMAGAVATQGQSLVANQMGKFIWIIAGVGVVGVIGSVMVAKR